MLNVGVMMESKMNLQEVLSQETPLISSYPGNFHLSGHLEPDTDPNFVRLYRDAMNKRSYFLIKKEDIEGDIYRWTDQELSQAGFLGQARYRISVKYGTVISSVRVKFLRVGDTIAGDTASRHRRRLSGEPGDCEYSPGCGGHNCCTYADDGECYCDDCCEA